MAHSKTLIALAIASVSGLSACGAAVDPCTQPTPGNRFDAADLMLDCLNTLNNTPVANMPSAGSATYDGFVSGAVEVAAGVSDPLLGDASLTANFAPGATGTVSGTLSNFTSGAVGAMTGSLSVTGGTIAGNSYSGATVSGAPLGYGTNTLSISGTSTGFFYGQAAQGLLGVVDATSVVNPSGYTDTDATLIIFGQD